jgi:single-stranded-DNA-specific exonuclease
VVKLDRNNRILVSQGLKRMRAGQMQAGIAALFKAAGRDPKRHRLRPRLPPRPAPQRRRPPGRHAPRRRMPAHRRPGRALTIAQQLDTLNRERREIEADMQEQALLESMAIDDSAAGIALFDESWHEGVVGILASRIKDKLHRPVFAFAPGEGGIIKGSGRSIPGLHLRDALDLVAKRAPACSASAATPWRPAHLREAISSNSARFRRRGELLDPADLTRTLETDGNLEGGYLSLETARLLENEIWGQGFPAPLFCDEFDVEQQRVLKEKHLKLRLRKGNTRIDAIQFNFATQPGNRTRAAYRLAINEYMGSKVRSS